MTTTDQTRGHAATERASLLGARPSARRRFTNTAMTASMLGAIVVAAVPLGLICWFLLSKGLAVVDWTFLTTDITPSVRQLGGMGPAVVGTVVITGVATLIAVPLGILGAIYLNEYGRQNPLARSIRFFADVMTGVPSIVMGLFVYQIWVSRFQAQTGFAGSLALAALMLPIVIRSTEEMLRLVPDELRQASLALGSRSWRTVTGVVLPSALPGITSGVMLAVARAAGETAPIILVTGITLRANTNVFEGQNTTLAAQIYNNASQAFDGAQQRAFGASLTLVLLVFVFTIAARVISSRFNLARS